MKKLSLPFSGTFRHFMPLREYFIQNRWPLVFGLVCLLTVDFLQLLIPLIIKKAIDSLTTKIATTQALLWYGAAILAIAVTIAFFRYLWRHLIFGHSRKVEETLRNRIYAHLQGLSLAFYQKMRTGDLMARAINDLNAIRMATGMGVVALTDGLLLGTAAIGFMLSIDMKLTLISLIPAPVIILLSRMLTRRMSIGFETVQNTFSDLTEQVREAFAGIRVIKAYGREEWENRKIRDEGEKYVSVNLSLAKTLALFLPTMTIFTNVGLAIVIWLGGRLTILGQITTGDFVAFISYLNLLTWPMMAMGWVTNLVQRGSASMRRINRILEEEPEIKDWAGAKNPEGIRGEISVKDLFFRYPGQRHDALKGLHFRIRAGETVAVVGRVGSGKTTFLYILPRLLEVPAGTVFLDGTDIRRIPLIALRQSMGFVTQDVFVFSDTIRNNIVFGRRGISQEDVEGALHAADIFKEVQDLDQGLDTLLGERGITLSGGQRQRLTIARALLSNPPILILDDALSMVDTRTEERILNRILKMRQDKTNLIVSHRISTITRADRILVLERGELVEEGSHGELLEQGGVYAALYQKQLLAQELETGGSRHVR